MTNKLFNLNTASLSKKNIKNYSIKLSPDITINQNLENT